MFEPVNMIDQLNERFRTPLLPEAVEVVKYARSLGFNDWADNAYLTLKSENIAEPLRGHPEDWKTQLIETCK